MFCIVIHKETGEMSIMTRTERERMLNVLMDLKQPIPDWVIGLEETEEGAQEYIKGVIDANNLIELALASKRLNNPF